MRSNRLASFARAEPAPPPAADASIRGQARGVAGHLARAFESLLTVGVAQRYVFSDLLRSAVQANPAFLGIWTVWEPDAVEGADAAFRARPGHDGSGRFVPYWNRARGELALELVTGFEHAEEGSWYWVPRERRQPCTAEPYLYPVGGRLRWIASELAPISARGLFLGVLGVDWAVDERSAGRAREKSPVVRVAGEHLAAERLRTLTAREHEVYFWLGQGKSNEEIGIILGISAHTVKNHMDHIFQKLGVSNRLAAALAAQV